jgi:hypothetical protein
MPRTCTICNHGNRENIEEALLSGESFRNIAQRFGTSATALFRHKTEHLPTALAKAHEAGEVLRADKLVGQVQKLCERTEALFIEAESVLNQAKRSKDLKTALAAIRELANLNREARGNATLLGQLTGELRRDKSAGDIGVQIVMPSAVRSEAFEIPIVEIDVIKR